MRPDGGPVLAQGPADEVTDAMARIFVWLRYSASRQLTWQRNYNTQPRILGEAQARLTNAIAAVRAPISPLHTLAPVIGTCICHCLTLTMSSFGVRVSFAKLAERAACAVSGMQAGCAEQCIKHHLGAVTCMC